MTKSPQVQTAKKPRKPKRKTPAKSGKGLGNWLTLGRLSLILAAIILIGAALIFTLSSYSGRGQWIYVTPGMENSELKDTLKSRLGTALGNKTYFLFKLQGGDTKNSIGAYKISDGQSALSISHKLSSHQQTPVNLTFTSARTLDEIAEKIAAQTSVSKKDFMESLSAILAKEGYQKEEFPSALIPNTYQVYWDMEPKELAEKLLKERDNFWDEKRTSAAKSLGLTPTEVATIASIVEEETSKTDEMAHIARVYLNRLKTGMKLQSDPTVKYAAGDPTIKRITGKHLQIESPYNTYRNQGLPPGPIRIPSGKTIDLVLYAPENNDIYMCARADFSGYHDFTDDYNVHSANAAKYQGELNRRGIK